MTGQVVCVTEQLTLPTYREPPAEQLPMFAENRVHQRSSGNPYPNRIVSDVDREHRENKTYTAIRLENEYLQLILLPELGGRIYSAYDKVNKYDFFYKQHVIKPALIGMLGSWISGGVEFNWPCHHRPSTFMPTDWSIQREPTGAVTVWMSEHDPLDRMKGMVGIRLAPGEAIFETRMRVYNRTETRKSFLWWENAAVPVNEQYRLFFPHDVTYVQFHYRKDVTTYPLASGTYNGIPLGENNVDLSFHKNTRQPTSYFCGETRECFFGGYDEGRQCGVVHVADRHTSVGKKMFTWAYNQLSSSWEKALTDTDGAYAELMASSYSLNQPDFAWLEPYETKKFSQAWYPIGKMGIPDHATEHAAIHLTSSGVTVQTTRIHTHARLLCNGKEYALAAIPCTPVTISCGPVDSLQILDADDNVLLSYTPKAPDITRMPETLPGLPTLDQITCAQDAYLAGVHVDQYRDPTIRPDAYFQKALKLEPHHLPSLIAMARYCYQLGKLDEAASFIEQAEKTATRWNFHPESGEIAYLKGLILQAQHKHAEAYDAYQQACWNQDRRAAAMTRIACMDGCNADFHAMLQHAISALDANADNGLAITLAAIAQARQGRTEDALNRLAAYLSLDPLYHLAAYVRLRISGGTGAELAEVMQSDPAQTCLDLAFDLLSMGEKAWASDILTLCKPTAMTAYLRAQLQADPVALAEASHLSFGKAYPSRQSEEALLKAVLSQQPQDTSALFGLGCLLYGKRRYQEAASCWERVRAIAPTDAGALRCLAVAYFSHLHRRDEAMVLLKEALACKPDDMQLIWENVYVMCRLGYPASERLSVLREHCSSKLRDDLAILWAQALNQAGKPEQALSLMQKHQFIPCEGGEHAVADQYMFANYAIGRKLLAEAHFEDALLAFRAAQHLPENLGSGLWHQVKLVPYQFCEALCLEHMGQKETAVALYRHILSLQKDFFTDMHLLELPCYQALCHARLGHSAAAKEILVRHIHTWRNAEKAEDPGYYASTPFFISYTEDAAILRRRTAVWQQAFALAALKRTQDAHALLADVPADPDNLWASLPIDWLGQLL